MTRAPLLLSSLLVIASPALAAEPTAEDALWMKTATLLPSAEILRMDGERVPLSSALKPVTVLLLWTSMCKDPVADLKLANALGKRFAKDPRVGVIALSVDQAKNQDDLAVIAEIAAPAAMTIPVVSDTGFKSLGFVEGKDFGGKFPDRLGVPLVAIVRGGAVVSRGGLPPDRDEAAFIAHYSKEVEAELAKLPKPPPAAKR